jgi:nitrite reductase/ring-hydroxylating ferredoxin subunit/uncharacterized membrane protein
MSVLDDLTRRIESWEALDAVGRPLADAVGRVLRPTPVRNLLSGTPLGHPLHPLLTDVPIGAWSLAALLDTAGGTDMEPAADLMVATGLAAAVPTAVSGYNDWSDTQGPENRVGLVHAVSNGLAVLLHATSLVARRSGHRRAGRMLSLVGLGALGVGGYLGGHLTYSQGVNVNRTAWREGPGDWTDAVAESELEPGRPHLAQVDDISMLLVRDGDRIHALDSVCSHMGGPLAEGTVADGCVTCPWHGSIFRLADGQIVRGPARTPQPSYEARVLDGRVQVRSRSQDG